MKAETFTFYLFSVRFRSGIIRRSNSGKNTVLRNVRLVPWCCHHPRRDSTIIEVVFFFWNKEVRYIPSYSTPTQNRSCETPLRDRKSKNFQIVVPIIKRLFGFIFPRLFTKLRSWSRKSTHPSFEQTFDKTIKFHYCPAWGKMITMLKMQNNTSMTSTRKINVLRSVFSSLPRWP